MSETNETRSPETATYESCAPYFVAYAVGLVHASVCTIGSSRLVSLAHGKLIPTRPSPRANQTPVPAQTRRIAGTFSSTADGRADQVLCAVSDTCVCGHQYDEHEGRGEHCDAKIQFPLRDGGGEQRCMCVYFEAREDEDGDDVKGKRG